MAKRNEPMVAVSRVVVTRRAAGFGLTINVVDAEPPPGDAFVTVTVTLPAIEISAAGTAATRTVGVSDVTATAFPPKVTLEAGQKPLPSIVNGNEGPPALVEDGTSPVTAGAGLLTLWDTVFDVLAVLLASPAYLAVME
jgi:hypothetical protein